MTQQITPTALISENSISNCVQELAAKIQNDYEGKPLTVLGIFNGSFIFLADLLRNIALPLQMESLVVSSYVGKSSTGIVEIQLAQKNNLSDRDILVVDDILETGLTLDKIRENLLNLDPPPRSVEFCVLLRKNCLRKREIEARYVGFDIEDEFVVGYGLDLDGRYRNLPYIGVFPNQIESL